MYHSVSFGEKNTWDDWMLIPTSRPLFNPPKRKTNYIEIPGASSALDLSEALTRYPLYNDREGSMEFYVENSQGEVDPGLWALRYSQISSYLNGMKMTAMLEDDPNYYYSGSFWVDSWKSEKDRSKIVIAYRVDPYKYKMTTETLVFDSQNPIRHIGGENHVIEMMPVIPELTITNGSARIKFVNKELGINREHEFNTGTHKPSWMILSNLPGLTETGTPWNVEFQNYSGAGTATITWRNGRL